MYDKQLHICIFYFNAFYFSISACYFMNSYVHGALSPGSQRLGRVLYAGRRHGDVTGVYPGFVQNDEGFVFSMI